MILLHRKRRRIDTGSQSIQAVRPIVNNEVRDMQALSEMFSLDSQSLALASGNSVAPGFVLSTLLSTTTSTNNDGNYTFHQ